MSQHFHCIVWLDHREAKLFAFGSEAVEPQVIRAAGGARHLHHHAGSIGSGHNSPDRHFLEAVAQALAPAGEILVVGPGQAKNELMAHLAEQHPALAAKVVKVETVDHPTDGQIVAIARKTFKAIDRMLPQLPT